MRQKEAAVAGGLFSPEVCPFWTSPVARMRTSNWWLIGGSRTGAGAAAASHPDGCQIRW